MTRGWKTTCVVMLGLALLPGLPGCGDDDGGGGVPLEEVPTQYVEMMCETVVSCGVGFAVLFPDVQSCVNFLSENGDLGAIDALVEAVQAVLSMGLLELFIFKAQVKKSYILIIMGQLNNPLI